MKTKKDINLLTEGYESAGVLEDVEAAKKSIEEMSEESRDPEEIDAFALGEAASITEKILASQPE